MKFLQGVVWVVVILGVTWMLLLALCDSQKGAPAPVLSPTEVRARQELKQERVEMDGLIRKYERLQNEQTESEAVQREKVRLRGSGY